MKFTLSWLKEHLDTDASLTQISETLTAIGLEVEEITDSSAQLAAFTVAEILEASPHPDADKLQICRVNCDEGELQIVCGAANARAGIKVALAKVGALIPNGEFKIKKSKIRGVESCGMLCSARELNLGEDHAGIMELPGDATIGAPIAGVLGLDDPLIEIAITPNRGDCLGVYGIARDLAAAGLGALKPLAQAQPTAQNDAVSITIRTEQCRLFAGILIEGVHNGPAPDWLQNKLKAIGLRPISTLVDITNYFTHTYGRPLHVYDADKLTGGIIVREGESGDKIEALNDKSYTLKGGECVIADEAGILGLGGIVGGVPSGVTETTTRTLLECAWFEPEAIAQTGRAHDVITDARYRFERTADKGFVLQGAHMAAEMIMELCGGQIKGSCIAGTLDAARSAIEVAPEKVEQLCGITLAQAQQQAILQRLGFEVQAKGDHYLATPPSYRPDVTQLADIAEEILRIYGYDKLPALSLPKPEQTASRALSPSQKREQLVRCTLAARGLHECRNWAFMQADKAALFGEVSAQLQLQNPISSDLDTMRPSLLAHLIDSARKNAARGFDAVALFEVGAVFQSTTAQQIIAASLRGGLHTAQQWNTHAQPASWQQVKADALAILSACGTDVSKLQVVAEAPDYYHPGRSGTITLGPKNILAYFGQLHPVTLQEMDCDMQPVCACEVFLDNVPLPKAKSAQPLKSSDFQASQRDFAFVMDKSAPAATLLKAALGADKQLIRDVALFDVYEGKGLEEHQKSLGIRVTLQAADRTLSDSEIEPIMKAIIAAAQKAGAQLRA